MASAPGGLHILLRRQKFAALALRVSEYGFDHDQIGAAVEQAGDGFMVGFHQRGKVDISIARA